MVMRAAVSEFGETLQCPFRHLAKRLGATLFVDFVLDFGDGLESSPPSNPFPKFGPSPPKPFGLWGSLVAFGISCLGWLPGR